MGTRGFKFDFTVSCCWFASSNKVRNNVKILFRVAEEHRFELYYYFGVICLIAWFVFNLYALRDWVCPSFFPPIYTADGHLKSELDSKTREFMMRAKISNTMCIPTAVVVIPNSGEIDGRRNAFCKVESGRSSMTTENEPIRTIS
ncbi:hypothetical protein M3Y94_00097000 [Aphelenchoides besseyi]|nr:hypothetical protein M3Y94_00097000 [Aphelenchoides besseyi]